MLLQFSVENFLSFRERASFDLTPGAGSELPENIARNGKHQALKSAALFGANASGKSNLIKAITAAVMIVRESEAIPLGFPLWRIVPFKLDTTSRTKPSSFEFIFVADDVKYVYGFSADMKCITEEYLYAYYTLKPTTIFERVLVDDKQVYSFKSDKKVLDELAEKNTSNKLFLSTMAAWNYKRAKAPFLWFVNQIDTYNGSEWLQDFSALNDEANESQKRFTIRLLEIADINISDYQILADGQSKDQGIYSVTTTHQVREAGKKYNYFLGLEEESAGTQHIFIISKYLKKAFENGKTLIVDGLDAELHPLILEKLIRMFHDSEINVTNAQVIFTTHNSHLLDLDIFRRDQIYFTEKSNETAASDLFSLDDFPVRKGESIRNGYLKGRYGALPSILG